jgi:hypothetical protein
MTQAEFGQALATVDPDELAFTGRLSEAQFKAGLSTALGLSALQIGPGPRSVPWMSD